jgi:hypothetical protein
LLWACCPEGKHRDGKKAVESAWQACKLSGWTNAGTYEVLAAAYAESGDFAEAIPEQKRALELMTPEYQKQNGQKARQRLQLYQDHKPYRDN